jgi:endonuclease III
MIAHQDAVRSRFQNTFEAILARLDEAVVLPAGMRQYGRRERAGQHRRETVFECIVGTFLVLNGTDAAGCRCLAALPDTFWQLRLENEAEIAAILRPEGAGCEATRARYLAALCSQEKEYRAIGSSYESLLNLDFELEEDFEMARQALEGITGFQSKAAACVILTALDGVDLPELT